MYFPNRALSLTAPFVFTGLLWGCSATPGDEGVGTGGTGTGGELTATGGLTNGTGGGGSNASGGVSATGGAASGGAIGTGGVVDTCTPSSGVMDVGTASFLDKATCLTWQKTNTFSGSVVNRVGSAHCLDLVQDGYDDWRLPTAQELRTYPNLPDSGNAYLAGPIYIPSNSTSDMDGCTGNSHSCNLTQYSAGNFGCAWQGPGGNAYGVLCVRGTAGVSLDPAFDVATCCSGSGTYKITDCSAYP